MARPAAVAGSRFPQLDVEVEGCSLRYVDTGPTAATTSGPPLIVIPGHTSRIEGYDELSSTLAERHRVLILDLPGSGYADKPERRYDLELYEDAIVGFLDALGIGEAVPVGGSLGGNLVLRLGHRFPDRFRRLVVWAPGSAWGARPRLARTMHWIGDHASIARLLFWPTVRVQSRFWYGSDFPGREEALRTTFAYYREVIGPGFVRMYWGLAADQIGTSLFDLAPEIEQPVLLMWGDRDNGAGMGRGVAKLHGMLPRSELHVFEGARHSLETELPVELARQIEHFVDHGT